MAGMKNIKWLSKALALCLIVISTSGCARILMGAMGLNQPKTLDDEQIARAAKKYGIPSNNSFVLDTNYYHYFRQMDSATHYASAKNHTQPLQALYYNRKGALVSFQVNCYAGGGFNLQWDQDSTFQEFPPKQQAPLDTIVPLRTQQAYMMPLKNTEQMPYEGHDYTVVVHWSRFFGRQSRRLIQFVQDNAALAGNKSVQVLYVNNDAIFGASEIEIVR